MIFGNFWAHYFKNTPALGNILTRHFLIGLIMHKKKRKKKKANFRNTKKH